jgi:IS605 OrfB family transposase
MQEFLFTVLKDKEFAVETLPTEIHAAFKGSYARDLLDYLVVKLLDKEWRAIERCQLLLVEMGNLQERTKSGLYKVRKTLSRELHAPTWQMERFRRHRDLVVKDCLHEASRFIIGTCIKQEIGTIVIGYNKNWQQNTPFSRRMNQVFVGMPFLKFANMIRFKAELVGIQVRMVQESYTSKCSFLDWESLEHHDVYAGMRTKRGLFVSSKGHEIHADIHGAFNIIRKEIPSAFDIYFNVDTKGIKTVKPCMVPLITWNPATVTLAKKAPETKKGIEKDVK